MKTTAHEVKHAIIKGIVKFIPCEQAEDETVCNIGDYWFYFLPHGQELNPAQFRRKYTYEEQAQLVVDALNDWDGIGISEDEANYYIAYIRDVLPKNRKVTA